MRFVVLKIPWSIPVVWHYRAVLHLVLEHQGGRAVIGAICTANIHLGTTFDRMAFRD